LGVKDKPHKMWLDGQDVEPGYWRYREEKEMLELRGLEALFMEGAWKKTWEIRWE